MEVMDNAKKRSEPVDWAKLPPEISAKILACLPVASVFQVRLVCKAWRDVVRDPVFLEERAWLHSGPNGEGTERLLLALGPNRARVQAAYRFDAVEGKWHPFRHPWLSLEADECMGSQLGGLIGLDGPCRNLWLGNPFTGTLCRLPRAPAELELLGIWEQGYSGHFKLVSGTLHTSFPLWAGFDSACSGSPWNRKAPGGSGMPDARRTNSVRCKDSLYWLRGRHDLLQYDLREHTRKPLKVSLPEDIHEWIYNPVAHSVQSSGTRVHCLLLRVFLCEFAFLLGLLAPERLDIDMLGMLPPDVMELDETGKTPRWKLTTRMPMHMFRELLRDRVLRRNQGNLDTDRVWFKTLKFVVVGDNMYFFSKSGRGVACDMSQEPPAWTKLARCPLPFGMQCCYPMNPWLELPTIAVGNS